MYRRPRSTVFAQVIPKLICANVPNSTSDTDESDSREGEIVYDGNNPLKFFDHDRQVNRFVAKKKLGDTGIKIWTNTMSTPTNANRAAIATAWVADV